MPRFVLSTTIHTAPEDALELPVRADTPTEGQDVYAIEMPADWWDAPPTDVTDETATSSDQ